MTAVTEHILDAWGAYRLPSDVGFCYLAYRRIEVLGTGIEEDLHGAMRGTASIAPGVDLTEPVGESWDAEQ
jgi:hypothetical protein